MIKRTPFCLLILFLLGCAATPPRSTSSASQSSKSQIFDPSAHRADDASEDARSQIANLQVPERFMKEIVEADMGDSVTVRAPEVVPEFRWIPRGYRVQLLQTTERQIALERKAVARRKFPEDSVYVVLRGATYRVRMGDFVSEQDAQNKVQEAKAAGYRYAFPVPDRVRVLRNDSLDQ